MDLKPAGIKKNHKKGFAAARKALKRHEAIDRNAAYQKLSLEEKATHQRQGGKVWRKLKDAI